MPCFFPNDVFLRMKTPNEALRVYHTARKKQQVLTTTIQLGDGGDRARRWTQPPQQQSQYAEPKALLFIIEEANPPTQPFPAYRKEHHSGCAGTMHETHPTRSDVPPN